MELIKESKVNNRVYIRDDDKEMLREISDYYGKDMIQVLKVLIHKEHNRISKNGNR